MCNKRLLSSNIVEARVVNFDQMGKRAILNFMLVIQFPFDRHSILRRRKIKITCYGVSDLQSHLQWMWEDQLEI